MTPPLSYHSRSKGPCHSFGRHHVQDGGACSGSQALSGQVEEGLDHVHLAGEDHGHGHGGVDVSFADSAEAEDHVGDAQAEAGRDQKQGGGLGLPFCPGPLRRTQTEQYEEQSRHKLPGNRPQETLGQDLPECGHCAPGLKNCQPLPEE